MDDRLRIGAAVGAFVVVATRLQNAIAYPRLQGFDAEGNWAYITHLTYVWSLPDPDVGWSTAHPPFFYYAAAGIVRMWHALGIETGEVTAVRLVVAAAGLGIAALAAGFVRRIDPERPLRALIAAGLIAFLPAHVILSSMVNEEIPAAFLASLALVIAAAPGRTLPRAFGAGISAGLAWLTKLTGLLAAAAISLAYTLEGLRARTLKPALARAALVVVVAGFVGGWYYARNWIEFGYVYPQDLPQHGELMFRMPPGDRSVSDYLRLPLATFTDPQLLNEDLLHSVWGSTYATLWYDGHRFFVPRSGDAARIMGTAILVLALLPTVALAIGVGRGVRRAWGDPLGPDSLLLLFSGLTLAGYVAFTWRNPWFAAVKGSYLLPLSVPFAVYASEALQGWLEDSRVRAIATAAGLLALATLVTLAFTQGLLWEKLEPGGLPFLGAETP